MNKMQKGLGALSIIMLILIGVLVYGTYLYLQNVKATASASPTPISRYTK